MILLVLPKTECARTLVLFQHQHWQYTRMCDSRAITSHCLLPASSETSIPQSNIEKQTTANSQPTTWTRFKIHSHSNCQHHQNWTSNLNTPRNNLNATLDLNYTLQAMNLQTTTPQHSGVSQNGERHYHHSRSTIRFNISQKELNNSLTWSWKLEGNGQHVAR